jgi:hypothetical protein
MSRGPAARQRTGARALGAQAPIRGFPGGRARNRLNWRQERREDRMLAGHGGALLSPASRRPGGAAASRSPQRVDPDEGDAERLEHRVQCAEVDPDPWLPGPEHHLEPV